MKTTLASKSLFRTAMLSVFAAALITGCSKDKDSGGGSVRPGQGEMKATINVSGQSAVNFSASGAACITIKQPSPFGGSMIQVNGSMGTSSPIRGLSVLLNGVTTTGVYTTAPQAVVTYVPDSMNPTASTIMNSTTTVRVEVTKLTDAEIEGTFTANIASTGGASGTVASGTFKGRF